MNRSSVLLALLAGSLLLSPLAADHRDEPSWPPRRGGPRIILFEHANFQGDSLTLYPGEEVYNFDGARFAGGRTINDRISSIIVEGGAELLVYEHSHYRGHVMRVTESIRNLADRPTPEPRITWNDRISSVMAGRAEFRRGPRDRPVDPDVVIRRAYEDLLGRAPDPRGLRDFRSLMIDQGWTEQMVRDHIRKGPEYRQAEADRIIFRAYEDLLHRQPDPGGLASYRALILNRGFTEQQVRDNIRRGEEYRQLQHAPPPPRPRREAPREVESDHRDAERR